MTGARPSPQVRGRCPVCGRMYSLTADGKIRKHPGEFPLSPYCPGSGEVPA